MTALSYSVGPHLSELDRWAVYEHHGDPTGLDPERRVYYGNPHPTREAAERAARWKAGPVGMLCRALVAACWVERDEVKRAEHKRVA